jgi:antagonist of KipI
MPALTVVRPGMLTTAQDLGRWGHQGSGVPVAGPMDAYSHRLANRRAGNPDGAVTLEVTLIGPELTADEPVVCAVAGADFGVQVNGEAVNTAGAFNVPARARLRFADRRKGGRAYLAVRGGFDVEELFGSRATSVISRMGPFGGRALKSGDRLPIGSVAGAARMAGAPLVLPDGGARVHVMLGPHDSMFTRAAVETFFGTRFAITPQSNRMGYRLEGAPLAHVGQADILSDATPMGSLQVPASGQPILLMADRQTTGGYPKIATVITADLPIVGQLVPGDWIEFQACSRGDAIDWLHQQEARLGGGSA